MVDEARGVSAVYATPRRRRTLVLLGGLVGIVLWQSVFFRHGYPETTLDSPYRLEASGGVLPWQPDFVYFLYYLKLYPVASISTSPLDYSVEGARRLVAEQGQSLVMDRYWTLRYGDLAKTYLYLPHVWLKGRPVRPRMLHANALGFTLALGALYAALWSAERALLGALLVALIGSNPFQVQQVYANNNVFGWPITVTVLLMALHVPFMRERAPRLATAIAIALLSGVLLGSLRQIRTEPVLVAVSAVGIYLTATRLRYWLRLALVLLLGVTFVWTSAAWGRHFDAKYREAYGVVKAAGGHTYDGPRHPYHFFWHALWCGLGDFDIKYGYQWSDLSAIRYAWSVMQRRGMRVDGFPPVQPDELDSLTTGVYWDRGGQYARTPFEVPGYIEVVRDKVLRDVVHDPFWYLSIIGQRFVRLISETTPPSLALGNGWSLSLAPPATAELRRGRGDDVTALVRPSPQPLWGLLTLAVFVWLLVRRDWFHVKLLAFTLPLTATAIAVYSGGGTPYYSIVHLVALAVVGVAAWKRLRAGGLGLKKPAAEWLSLRWARPVALGLVALSIFLGLGLVARRVGTTRAAAHPTDEPALAILRFDNQTSSDSLAWVGDALGELVAEQVAGAGVRLLDPEAVEWLDADLVVWSQFSILSGPRTRVINIVADRSGAGRIVAGRVYQDRDGVLACVEVLAPGARVSRQSEHCERIGTQELFATAGRLAGAVLRSLGGASAAPSAVRLGSEKAFRFYTEAQRAARRQTWGKAVRLLGRSLREDPDLRRARVLEARVSSRWQPLARHSLRALTSTASLRDAVDALRAEVSRSPRSVEARMDLGRVLVQLELFDEAVQVLGPLLGTPGVPAEAFGLLAATYSGLGKMAEGYQAILEARRRSWQEPRGLGLMGDHLTRWGHFELATVFLNDAENERRQVGMPPQVLDDLLSRWNIRALQREWPVAQQLASEMLPLDDPRAGGAGTLRLALGYLFQGRSRLAGALAEEAAVQFAQQDVDAGEALGTAVQVRFERNDAAGALDLVRSVRPAQPDPSDRRVAFWEAVVLGRLRQWAEADTVRRRLAQDLSGMPGPVGPRVLHHLEGELSLLRGDSSGALSSLALAAELLPARGFCGDHVPIWYALAKANLAAGRPEQARTWLQRVAGASYERLCWPIPYARSLALLGRVDAAAGRQDEAADAYASFLRLWGDADLAKAEQDEARRLLLAWKRQRSTPALPGETEAESDS